METLDKELLIDKVAKENEESLTRILFHYVLLIIIAVLYLFLNNFISNTISLENPIYKKLLVTIFVMYPVVCVIFGAFMAIFKVKNYTYIQRLALSVLKLLAMFFVATAFIFTMYQASNLFVQL